MNNDFVPEMNENVCQFPIRSKPVTERPTFMLLSNVITSKILQEDQPTKPQYTSHDILADNLNLLSKYSVLLAAMHACQFHETNPCQSAQIHEICSFVASSVVTVNRIAGGYYCNTTDLLLSRKCLNNL